MRSEMRRFRTRMASLLVFASGSEPFVVKATLSSEHRVASKTPTTHEIAQPPNVC